MYKIRLSNEFLHGPIWVMNSDGIPVQKHAIIENDPVLTELNHKAMQLYSSYFEFNSHGVSCWFNHEKEKNEKDVMLSIISQIKKRLEEINDGSFTVEDFETERLNNL